MRARVLGALPLALLALAVALAGCGGGSDETTNTDVATGGETERGAGKQAKPESGKNGSRQGESAKKKSDAPAPSEQAPPNEGSNAVTPGVPTAKGGDNSIQEFGVEGESGERAQAAATAKAYLDARAAGRWSEACADLAAAMRRQIEAFAGGVQGSESAGCPAAMRALTEGVSKGILRVAADIDVLSMRIEGSRAFLIYRDGDGVPSQIPMAREGDEWKVGAVAGSPLIL